VSCRLYIRRIQHVLQSYSQLIAEQTELKSSDERELKMIKHYNFTAI